MNLFPLPNAVDPTGTNQYNYVVPDRAGLAAQRSGAARGLERRAEDDGVRTAAVRATRSAPAACRSSARPGGWPQMPTQLRDRHRQLRRTRCCTRSIRRRSAEFTVGVNWAHQNTSAVRRVGARLRTTAGWCCRACRSSSRRRIPLPPAAAGVFTGGVPRGNTVAASFGVEQRLPFFGFNTLFNVSGNVTKMKGAHTMKTGVFVERTTRPARAVVELQRDVQLQHRRRRTRSTRTSASRTRCSAQSRSTRSRTATRRAHGEFLQHRVLRAGQLARRSGTSRSTPACASTT